MKYGGHAAETKGYKAKAVAAYNPAAGCTKCAFYKTAMGEAGKAIASGRMSMKDYGSLMTDTYNFRPSASLKKAMRGRLRTQIERLVELSPSESNSGFLGLYNAVDDPLIKAELGKAFAKKNEDAIFYFAIRDSSRIPSREKRKKVIMELAGETTVGLMENMHNIKPEKGSVLNYISAVSKSSADRLARLGIGVSVPINYFYIMRKVGRAINVNDEKLRELGYENLDFDPRTRNSIFSNGVESETVDDISEVTGINKSLIRTLRAPYKEPGFRLEKHVNGTDPDPVATEALKDSRKENMLNFLLGARDGGVITERQFMILDLKYGLGMGSDGSGNGYGNVYTFREIAKKTGFSYQLMKQHEVKAVQKLRALGKSMYTSEKINDLFFLD
ncbi:MAG: hypothetical protein V1648_05065 [Candidatus Aenigmatarchaeota archaeon]